MKILLAILIVILTTMGQILLKKGAVHHDNRNKSLQFIALGYALFVLTIVLSYLLMKLIPMKYFTVIMSLNYVTVMFAAYVFLDEKLEQRKIIGTLMVSIGIFIFMLEANT